MGNLKRAQQAFVKQLMWRQAGDVFPGHGDTARRWWKNARYHIEKSGFTRAIRPDQPGDGALRDFHAGPIHGVKTAEVFVNIVNDDHALFPRPVRPFLLEQPEGMPRAARFQIKRGSAIFDCGDLTAFKNDFAVVAGRFAGSDQLNR